MDIKLSCGSEIDDRNSQYGDNMSPGVDFLNVPDEAESLMLLMEDLNAPGNLRVHWVIWNIPPHIKLPEGVSRTERPKVQHAEAVQGNNDYHVMGYLGPKYPPGNETYRFTAYALDKMLNIDPGSRITDVKQAMKGHVIDKSVVEAGYTN